MLYGLYQRLARELGLRLSPPDPGMMTFSFDLIGELEGHPVKLRRLCGSGARVDISSPIRPHLDLGIGLTRAGIVSKVYECLGKQDIQLGDPEFDKAFTIRGDEAERVKALLTPELRMLIASVRTSDFELTDAECSTGHRVTMGGHESYGAIAHELHEVAQSRRCLLPRAHRSIGATARAPTRPIAEACLGSVDRPRGNRRTMVAFAPLAS